ncbi:MAG: Ger(x)C family spore germination protein [Clostridia bacterium]|nr:Ger(x)C family spore germination protein [Clostridia bacterium]
MKNKKTVIYMIVLAVLFTTMAGSWSRKEPKHLALSNSYLYDVDEDGNYEITVEYLDSPSGGTTAAGNEKFVVMTHKGKTPPTTIRDPGMTVEKDVFGAHNRVRFFSERLAKKGVLDLLDFFVRGYITDERPYLIVIKNEDPGMIYKADKGFSDRVGDYIYEMGDNRGERTLYSAFVRTLDFCVDYYTEGQQCVTGVVEVKPNPVSLEEAAEDDKPKKYYMSFEGLAVFKEDKLVGYLDGEDTMSYKLLADKAKDSPMAVSVEGEDLSIVLRKSSSKIKTSMKDGKPIVEITLTNMVMISQNNTKYCVSDKDELKIVEEAMNKDLSQRLKKSITKVQTEYKSDIYGFGKHLHMQQPKEWKKVKDAWDDEYFPKAEVTVTVKNMVDFEGQSLEKFGEKNVKQRKY